MWLMIVLGIFLHFFPSDGEECNKVYFEYGFTCSCHEDDCDFFPPISLPDSGTYLRVSSSEISDRFKQSTHSLITGTSKQNTIFVDSTLAYQQIIGFGGSISDAVGIHAFSLSKKTYGTLMKSYYSSQGLEYNMLRIPMAGTDFSTRCYSYDDHPGDVKLEKFSLAEEDYKYKIPMIQSIFNMTSAEVFIFASPWSAPKWMKTNNKFNGKGVLRPDHYGVYARYFVKFLDAYKKLGIPMWGLTIQNQPITGMIENFPFTCMGWTAKMQLEFIKHHLGPELERSGYSDVQLMIMDDDRYNIPIWTDVILSDPIASKYAKGTAVHFYWDKLTPDILTRAHENFPNHFILGSEACGGRWDNKVRRGSWARGEDYALDIIQDLNHWVVGWMDWNLALDMTGGPNWAKNFKDSPILVDAAKDTFYKQPMYYAMGHFSKFIPRGSFRIGSQRYNVSNSLESTSLLRPDGYLVTIVVNKGSSDVPVQIQDSKRRVFIKDIVSSKSFVTYVWKSV